jgi:hypothetical protein
MVRHPFAIIYDPEVKHHFRAIELKYHSLIFDKIDEQLTFQPNVQTRTRTPLENPAPLGADWEIRFGPDNRFRVFYRIDPESHEVVILAVGVKAKERLYIGGEEV